MPQLSTTACWLFAGQLAAYTEIAATVAVGDAELADGDDTVAEVEEARLEGELGTC